jgi:hypothetical protein
MKKLLSIIAILSLSLTVWAKDYNKAMTEAIDKMYQARTSQEYLEVANVFDRIGSAEQDEWLPYYYSAFCYTMLSTNTKEAGLIDEFLDKADEYLATAEQRKGDKVEVLAMKGFTAMLRISVDPATRGQEYSMKSIGFLQQAMQIDNKNPRVVLMLGQMQYGTAQFFGSGTSEACEMFNTALELFITEESQDLGLNPSWGKSQVESMLTKCEG